MTSAMAAVFLVVVAAIAVAVFLYNKNKKGKGGGGGGGGGGGSPVGNLGWEQSGPSGKASISFYGQTKADDNGIGLTGVDLFKYGTSGVKFQGKPVFPIAVHEKDSKMLYNVLSVKGNGIKPFLGHVVDVCNMTAGNCNDNVRRNGMSFLVDIHKTAFDAVGAGDNVLTGEYTTVGRIPPTDIPEGVFTSAVRSGKSYMLCSCKGDCLDKSRVWKALKDCR
jgi:hypothetical protein